MKARLPELVQALPAGLQTLNAADAELEHVLAALSRDGAVVVSGAVPAEVADRVVAEMAMPAETADRVLAEMQPYLDAQGLRNDQRDATHGGSLTKRLGGVVARAPSSWPIVAHPLLLQVCHAVLGKQLLHKSEGELAGLFRHTPRGRRPRFKFQCHLHQLIQLHPGNEPQPWHEDMPWEFNFDAQIEPEVSTMWALSDFTRENGATRLVLGSHRRRKEEGYGAYRDADAVATVAECPKGSVVIFLGHLIHAGGANATQLPRTGLNVDYCLAWLRQECNQFLDVPPSAARRLPRHISELIGYSRVHSALGYFDAFSDPEEALSDEREQREARSRL